MTDPRWSSPGYTEGAGGDLTMSLSGLPDFRTEQTKDVTIPPILKTKWTQEGTYAQKLAKYGDKNTVTGYLSTWLSEWVRSTVLTVSVAILQSMLIRLLGTSSSRLVFLLSESGDPTTRAKQVLTGKKISG